MMLRSKNRTNSLIGETLQNADFYKDTNPHKTAIIWASNFHRILGNIMRTVEIQRQLDEYPNTVYFINAFLDYFDEYGVTKEDIIKSGYKYVFRGMTDDFEFDTQGYRDTSFISTSLKVGIAKRFSQDNGNFLIFDLDKMDASYKFVVINHRLNTSYQEEEVLLLPGHINILETDISKHRIFAVSYKMDEDRIGLYRKHKREKGSVGGSGGVGKFCLDCPNDLTFAGKVAVFYRVVVGKPVQVINYIPLPDDDEDKAMEYFATRIMNYRDELQSITHTFPEYMELKKQGADSRLLLSYNVRLALYDREKHVMQVVDFGMPRAFVQEIYGHAADLSGALAEELHRKYPWLARETRSLESLPVDLQEIVKEIIM